MNILLDDIILFLRDEKLYHEQPTDGAGVITNISPITKTTEGSLSWMRSQGLDWDEIRATAIICELTAKKPPDHPAQMIPVANPRLAFAKVLQRFAAKPHKAGIEPTALIGENCSISPSAYVGHYSVIGDDVVIGDNTVVRHHVVINDNTEIGHNCLLKSHCVIGEKGFGFEDDNGVPLALEHLGGVRICDFVEVGSFTTVVRGTLGNTEINNHAKLDDHVHIAHNVKLGEGVMVTACAEVSGSSKVGDRSWIAPNATIKDAIDIGEDVIIGMGAVVTKDVESGSIMAGNPAKLIKKRTNPPSAGLLGVKGNSIPEPARKPKRLDH